MSSLFAGATVADTVEKETDSVGGRILLDSRFYDFNIKMAYADRAKSGAVFLSLELEDADGNSHIERAYYLSKAGLTTYNREGKDYPLMGYSIANAVALFATGKGISEQESVPKTLKLYSADAGKEVNKEVETIPAMIGQTIRVGIVQQIVNKSEKQGDGSFANINEEKHECVIEKVIDMETNLTVSETLAELDEPVYYNKFMDKLDGTVRNKYKEVKNAPVSGAPAAAGGTTNMFSKKG